MSASLTHHRPLPTSIVVEGRLWGLTIAGSTKKQALPADTEASRAFLTDLAATATANAESPPW